MRIDEVGGFKKSQIQAPAGFETSGENTAAQPESIPEKPILDISMHYCNMVIEGKKFKKADLNTATKFMSPQQKTKAQMAVNEGLTIYMWENKEVDYLFVLVDEATGDVTFLSPDGKTPRVDGAYRPEPVIFKALEAMEDFPAGWYQVATYRESTNKFSPIVIRLGVFYKAGIGLAQLYIPVNNSYYIEGKGGGIPQSVFKQIQNGLVEAHKTYADAKSDAVDIDKLIDSGIFPGAHREN